MKKVMLATMCLLVFAPACIKTQFIDPETGQVTSLYSIDPNALATVEKRVEQAKSGADAAAAAAGAGSAIFPWAATIAAGASAISGVLGGALAALRRIKPTLIRLQSEAQMYHTISSSTVLAIDEFKKASPDQWKVLAEALQKIKDKIIKPEDQLKIENIIRGLRGLPAKV